jgi:hypothetical protein
MKIVNQNGSALLTNKEGMCNHTHTHSDAYEGVIGGF